jgi:hypothetical protein
VVGPWSFALTQPAFTPNHILRLPIVDNRRLHKLALFLANIGVNERNRDYRQLTPLLT